MLLSTVLSFALIEISEACWALAHEQRAKHESQAPGSLKIQNHSSPTFAHTYTQLPTEWTGRNKELLRSGPRGRRHTWAPAGMQHTSHCKENSETSMRRESE